MSGDVFNGEQWQAVGSAEASKREEESRAGNSWQSSWGEFGNTVKNVEEGIGYMLPSVVAGFATGGESLVAQASVQAGISAASGYGRSVESALDDGADYDRAMAYAAVKGGAEGATSFATTFIGGNVAAKTGGSAVSNLGSTVGKQVYAKTGNATAKIIAAKATELVAQAGISYTKAFAKTMAEPAFKQIYDDDAIKEAYGSDEGLSRTLSMAQSNALMASVTTAVVGVAKEGTKLAVEGKDAYRAEFLMEEAYRDSVKYCNEMKRYANEYKQKIDDIDKRIDSNQLSQADGDKLKNAAKEALIDKTGKIQAKLETTAKNIQDAQDMIKPGLDKESAKKKKLNETQLTEEEVAKKNDEIKEALKEKWSEDSKKDLKNLKNKKYSEYNKQNGITNETVAENYISKTKNLGDTLSRLKMAFSADEIKREASDEVITKTTTQKIIESVFSENQPYDDISEQILRTYLGEDGKYETLDKTLTDLNDRVKFMKDFKFGVTDEGEVYSESKTDSIRKITYGDNGKMNSVVIRTEKGTEEIKVKNGKLVADSPKKLAEIASALSESKINGGLSVSSDAKTASVPEVASESITTEGKKITLSDNAMRQIASSDELPKAIMNADYSKSYMLGKSNDTAISVQPLSDGSGKSVIMEIDGKNNEVKSVRIGSAKELSDRVAKTNYIVIPKKDLDRIGKTKAVDRATGKPITADVIGMESYGDGYATLGIRQTTGNWEKDSAAGFFVYSKRPLYSSDFAKKITFGKVVDKLGVSESLSKTYAIKTAQGADKAIDWLKKVTGLETNELFSKLGYDSYINEKKNEITTFDYSNIINQGAKVDYGEKGLLLDDGKTQNGKDDVGSGQERDVARRIAEDDRWNESESLENAKTRLGYATEVRKAGGYTEVEGFGGKKFCVIKDGFLPPELRELKDLGDSLGASVFFVLSNAEGETMNGAEGFYQPLTDEIYVSVDNISDSSVRNAVMHEIGHALFAMNGLEEKYGIKAKILDSIANGDKELSGIFKSYVRIWNYDGKDHSAWLESAGSDGKPIDLTSEFDEKTIDLIAEEMSNQIYVGEEVLHGKNAGLATYIKESYDESLNEGNEEELALENDMYDYYGGDSEEYDLEITNGQESLLKKNPQSADDKSKYNEEVSINPDFEPMQAHAKVEFNKDKNKWDVEITDKYTNRTLPTVSFKTKGSAERWLERRAGKDGKIIRTYSNEGDSAGQKLGKGQNAETKPKAISVKNSSNKDEKQISNSDARKQTPAKKEQPVAALAKENESEPKSISKANGNLLNEQSRNAAEANVAVAAETQDNIAQTPTENANVGTKKIVTDIERKSAANLIESGADVSKPTKVRLKDVKEAFTTALDETIPENSKAHISFQSVKDTFAEVNLAKKKDSEAVASNILARIKDTKVTITTEDGDETLKLGDMMTDEQANQALDIVNNAIKGKTQATELSKWAKSLSIEKIKGKENVKTFKLVSAIEKKVQSGSKEYLSTPGVAPMELSTYSKIIEGIKGPLTGATLTKLAENVIAVYNDAFSDMLAGYGIESNDMLVPMAEMLMQEAGSGAQATEKGLVLANQILDSVSKEMTNLKKGIKSSNYEKARDGVVLAQAGFGISEKPQGKGAALRFASKVKSVAASLDHHVRSPISILTGVLGENHPYVVHLADGGKACENAQAQVLAEWKDKLFGKDALGGKSTEWLQRELRKKIDFKGEKITVGQAIKIINTSRTAKSKDDFLKRGISFKINGKRADFLDISKEELQALEDAIPEELAKWNDGVVMPFLNGDCKTYIEGKYKTISGVELKMNDGFYYPTSAIGDKAPDISGNSKGSINPNDWGLSFFKERVKGTVAPYNANGDVLSDLVGYIQKVSQWGEWSQWYKTLRIMEDTRAFGVGTSLNAILSKNVEGWDVLNDFIHKSALGISFGEGKGGLMKQVDSAVGGLFSNIQQVAMMDIFTQIKTLGSDFTGWQFFGAKDVIQGIINYYANGGPVAEKHAREVIEKYSPTLKTRFATSEAISANLGKEIKNGVVMIGTTPVRILDTHIHLKAFFMAQVQARRELGPNATQDEIDERTVRILEKYSDTTQPTTSKFRVAMYRSGYDGQIVKQVFGMFQSMGQNIYQGLYDVTKGWFNQITIMKNYEDAIKYYDDRIALYAKTEEENREKANGPNLSEEEIAAFKKKADEAKYHKEGNERSKQTVNETLNKMRGKYTWKNYVNKAAGFLAGLIGSGLVLTLISNVKNMTYGNKEWDDWDAKEIAEDTAYQSFVNWIPIVGTIANSIKNDSDLTVFTIDNLNSFISASKEMIQSFGEGNGARATGKTLAFLMQAATLFGIPAQSIWKLANGIWYNVDKESNLNFRASLGFLSANSIKTNYSDALKKGQSSKAVANIDVWMSMYSANSGKEVASEIYRLNRLGISNVAPSAVPSTYTDGSGEKAALTQAQSDAFRQMYSKGGSQAKSLVASSLYQSLDDEYKGRALKQLYSAYAQAAKYKAYGALPTSKIGKLLAQTNGDLELARYIAALQSLGGKAKDDAVKAVNKLSGFTKAEKLLVMWMNGYKLTDANARLLVNWLVSKGSSPADASALINS